MALPPIVKATLQSAVLGGLANFLAQFFRSYRLDIRIYIDWVPVVQFVILSIITTPPNIMWGQYLEQSFPAHAPQKPADKGEKKPAGAPPLNVRNTVIKTLLDQTVGSAVNTFLFALSMNFLAQAMTPLQSETELLNLRLAGRSLDYLLSGGAMDASRVDWEKVIAQSRADFWPIVTSGWTFWPFVSIVNFAFVKEVQTRNLVGGLAGIAWGMYMSGFAAR
ncbi:related to glomerulosclerosis protein Mpv17 [Cephalotrichum gorgonifer]|uniref:Related to glomerulosclerosis protein Mpv17 n=1 Tax=Cephalotrichum gorgonifer TaxID=2041049 RepID=A0AAE8N2T1_9PEZI|nr:related to glomerulosclerosis protein Mpv17 [Cephalotrichum gorgonifer]